MHVIGLEPIDRSAATDQPAVVLATIARPGQQHGLVGPAEPAYRITRPGVDRSPRRAHEAHRDDEDDDGDDPRVVRDQARYLGPDAVHQRVDEIGRGRGRG